MEDLPINNQLAEVDTWKPYDFLTFVEEEMRLRGKEYQVLDLQVDLGALKGCMNYAKAMGKGNYAVVQYITWLLDGITDQHITSLQFLMGPLRSYFGDAPAAAAVVKKLAKQDHEVKLSVGMKAWLDTLLQNRLF